MDNQYTPDEISSKLKFAAKQIKQSDKQIKQAEALDKVAEYLGYKNWSLLHKNLYSKSPEQAGMFVLKIKKHPKLGGLFSDEIDAQAARQEMENWVRKNYSRLVDFAFFDRESENGYAWPSVELNEELQEEFSDQYPYELIEEVAIDLEMNNGPWGIENYGD